MNALHALLTTPAPQPISEGQFQSAWYYSIIIAAMVILVLLGTGWSLRGAVRVWREGDHAAASVITVATLTGTFILIGLFLTGVFGLHSMFRGG
ncbi:MAG: hypothetical protein ABR498_02165 [Candidatus Dormibacteria bacterium]